MGALFKYPFSLLFTNLFHIKQKLKPAQAKPVEPTARVIPQVPSIAELPKAAPVKEVKKAVVPVVAPVVPVAAKKVVEQKAPVPQPKPVERPVEKKLVVPAPQLQQPALRGDEVDAPTYKPAAAAVVEQKVKNDPPATIEVPQKVVAPGITPPNVPPANPKPEAREQKPRRVLDGQDGITQACLLPPKREKKRGAVPPPNLGGEAPAASRTEKPRAKPVVSKFAERPAVPSLNIRREPEVTRREDVPLARMLERERERYAPQRDLPNYRDLRMGGPEMPLPRGLPAPDRHMPAPERRHPGAGLAAPDLERLRYGQPPAADMLHRPFGANPRDLHVPGGMPHFPPASHLPGFPPVGAGLPRGGPLLDDAALARRIAMEEYSW